MSKKPIYLTVKDHSVSGEDFQLLHNDELDLLETSPQPNLKKLPEYYKSEDYISHTDAKRNLFEKAYHVVKSISLKRKLRIANYYVRRQDQISRPERKLLDIGCGTGDFLQTCKNNNWNVFGVEPNKKARTIANSKTNNSVHEIDELIKLEANSFDVITLWHVLEHLQDLDNQIQIFKKLLKDNGTLIIAVPNYKSYDAKRYKNFWAAFDVPRHLWHFSRTSISKLMEMHQFQVVKTLPMLFDAFYVSLLSEKYKSGKMNFFKAFFVALYSNFKAIITKEYSSVIYVIKKR